MPPQRRQGRYAKAWSEPIPPEHILLLTSSAAALSWFARHERRVRQPADDHTDRRRICQAKEMGHLLLVGHEDVGTSLPATVCLALRNVDDMQPQHRPATGKTIVNESTVNTLIILMLRNLPPGCHTQRFYIDASSRLDLLAGQALPQHFSRAKQTVLHHRQLHPHLQSTEEHDGRGHR